MGLWRQPFCRVRAWLRQAVIAGLGLALGLGLIEATLSNLDLLGGKTPFSRFFYPLRIFIYLATPILFFVGLVFFSIGIFLYNPIVVLPLFFVLVLLGIFWRQNLLFAFVINQFYLLAGLLNLGKDMRVWESTSDKKMGKSS